MTILYKILKYLALPVLSLIAVSCGTRNTGGATAADGDLAAHIETVVISHNPSVSPQAAGFLRLWCKEPVKKDYSIVLKYADGKYPPQALSLTLHPSGAQLYNEMQNKK